MDMICRIEVIKDGVDFVIRAYLASGPIKEFRHHSFEDVLTEMAIDIQEILGE